MRSRTVDGGDVHGHLQVPGLGIVERTQPESRLIVDTAAHDIATIEALGTLSGGDLLAVAFWRRAFAVLDRAFAFCHLDSSDASGWQGGVR